MRRLAVLLAIAIGTALVLAVSLTLAGCTGDESGASPKTRDATVRSAAAETTAPAETQGQAEAASIRAGSLDPGTYESGPSFRPALRLTIDEPGWRALFEPDDDELALEHEDGSFLALTRVTRVVDPKTHGDVSAPEDLARWLREHPALQPTETAPASVGGATGTRIDTSSPPSQTDLFWYPTGSMHINPDLRWRVFVVDVDGTPLTIVFGAPTASFEQAVAKLEPLLSSVEFD